MPKQDILDITLKSGTTVSIQIDRGTAKPVLSFGELEGLTYYYNPRKSPDTLVYLNATEIVSAITRKKRWWKL